MSDKSALLLFDPSYINELLEQGLYTYVFMLAISFPVYVLFGEFDEASTLKMLYFSYKLLLLYHSDLLEYHQ